VHKIFWRFKHLKTQKLRVFHQPMDLLMFSLLFADVIQAIGGIQNLKWIRDGVAVEGSFCTAQGIIKNIGETGVALSTFAIAVYTLVGVFSKNIISSMKVTLGVLFVIWAFILIIVTIPNVTNHRYQSPVPHWCWIGKNYVQWRLLAEYIWIWVAFLSSIAIYILLYLWMRGNIALGEQTWWRCSFRRMKEADPTTRNIRRRSLVMLAYPMVYAVIAIPLSVVRWLGFTEEIKTGVNSTRAEDNFAVLALFGLSGFLNVILLLTTRPLSGLFGKLMFTSEARPPSPLPVPYVKEDSQEEDPEDVQTFGRLP